MGFSSDELIEEWKKDSEIDPTSIVRELARTPSLHAKYLGYYMKSKEFLIKVEKKYNRMRWIKRKYFRGELEKHELEQYGWSQWNGLKPSISELNELFDSDRDLNNLMEEIKGWQALVQALEYIMKQISQRDWGIKTMVEHTKYLNGG